MRAVINLRRFMGWSTDIELADDEWTRPPRIRRQAAELDMEAESTVIDWRPRQRWTTDKPTKRGYYWCRVPRHDAKVVEVYVDGLGRLRMVGMDFGPTEVPSEGLLWGSLAIQPPLEKR